MAGSSVNARKARPPLAWHRQDIEQKLLFRGGRFTRVNTGLSLLLAALLTGGSYGVLVGLQSTRASWLSRMFVTDNPIPYTIVFFTAWALAILMLKWRKLAYQRRTLAFQVVPDRVEFVLGPRTVDQVTEAIYKTVDQPKHFVLFNRMMIALGNLRNLGRVADVDDVLRAQGDNDESMMESSYALLTGLVWAIPVLGFIGTVLGLSSAIGEFGAVLQTAEDMSQIKENLQKVTGGLSIAFETTLQALVAALMIQLMMTFLKKNEQEFLDECTDYCLRHVVGRLKVSPVMPDAIEERAVHA